MLQETSSSKAENAPWVKNGVSQGVESRRVGLFPYHSTRRRVRRNTSTSTVDYMNIVLNSRRKDDEKVCNDDLPGCAARPLAAPLTVDTLYECGFVGGWILSRVLLASVISF
jgi:hypothetical protein